MSRTSTGSVYQRADNGYWVAAVTVNGRRITRYAKTKTEARQILNGLLNQQSRGTLAPPSKLTLREWTDHWLASLEGERRASTLAGYRERLAPALQQIGHLRLDRLTPLTFTVLFSDLRRNGVGSASVAKCYTVLGTCLGHAMRLGLLSHNPLRSIECPRHQPKERAFWTLDETRRFLDVATKAERHFAPLLVFLLATGLRKGEALGLRRSDIDWTIPAVRVSRAIVVRGRQRNQEAPKTAAGKRTLTLSPLAVEALQRLPTPIDVNALLFLTRQGRTPSESTLRESFQSTCRLAGVPPIPIHGLRHVHAALLASEGIDPHTLSRRLGHSRIDVSLNVYAYALRSDRDAAAAFERAVGS